MRLTFTVRWEKVSFDEYRRGRQEPGPTVHQLVRLEVEVMLTYNKGNRKGRRCRGLLLFMEADKFLDADRLRDEFLRNREVRQLEYVRWGYEDGIDEVLVQDPENILTWLGVDPASLLPNDQTFKYDQSARLLTAPPRG